MSTELTPKLVTVPNIQICAVGEEWQLSTGPLTVTPDHIVSVIESQNDPAVKSPRVRFGHQTEWPGVSEPSFGTYINLRADDDGMTLVGDLAGVPEWFATIAPAAYPNRSMDGWTDATTHTGNTWPLLIEAVSFLGIVLPGINTLTDLAAVWNTEPPACTEVTAGTEIYATRGGANMGKPAEGSVGTDDLRKAFYNDFAQGDRYWWWIRQTFLDPTMLIVDDDEGSLWAVEYTASADGAVTFAEPQEIVTQYVYKDGGAVAAAVANFVPFGTQPAAVYASPADSRPDDRKDKEDGNVGKPKQASTLSVDRAALAKSLGLPEDADEDAINAKLAEQAEADAEADEESTDDTETEDDEESDEDDSESEDDDDETEPGGSAPASRGGGDDLTKTVDAATFDGMQADLKRLKANEAKAEGKRRDGIVSAAVREGRVARARAKAWRKKFDADPEGTETMLTAAESKGGLPKNMVPVDEVGIGGDEEVTASSANDDTQQAWYANAFPELAANES